nr:unnamed protein product [Haemonchus contortus]
MDLQNVPADVKTYIMNAIQRASRWHLPNGDSWKNSKALKIKNAAVVGGSEMSLKPKRKATKENVSTA